MHTARMRRTSLGLIVVLALGLAACSEQAPEVAINDQVPIDQRIPDPVEGEEGEAPAGASFETADAVWVAEGLAFTSSPSTVPADGAVLGLDVVGGTPHNVIFEGFQGDQILVDGPGEGEFATERSIPSGQYTYYCGIVGHRGAGMEGTVTVE